MSNGKILTIKTALKSAGNTNKSLTRPLVEVRKRLMSILSGLESSYANCPHDTAVVVPIALSNTDSLAFVDESVLPRLLQHNWYLGGHGYACRTKYVGGYEFKSTIVYMHREIFEMHGIEIGKHKVDHKDTNKLNNSFLNLRLATQSQNMSNRGKQVVNTSGYKGVRFHKPTGKWQAYIKVNYKQKHLGLFEFIEDAAFAYNQAALKFHGEFAYLNEVNFG